MVFGLAVPAAAQSAAMVVGSIVDQNWGPACGRPRDDSGCRVRMADTDVLGDFAFPGLAERNYEVLQN